ncbi:MAG TPA: PIG-L family deacetylase [Thermoanaerobaculia bacterium]|nr:PIG-L family deacetylase [Thermoanaerobaculia bacterium]
MLIEAEAIPYEPARLRGERLLVLAPHPDDEVIGCGGLLAQHLQERRATRVVIATDGAEAGNAETRQRESRAALSLLGSPEILFLGHPDRQLGDEASAALREAIADFHPDLILVPSPIEIHPDHFALARLFCELVQRDETLSAELAVARVAFYEVGQPIRPNALVDISDVAETKYAAIAQHASQLALRDYVAYARGLNAYRAMTLPAEVKFAEAYYVVDLPSLRTTPISELRRMTGAPRELAVTRETVPISVIVRTKDRPALLREAIDSIRASEYPCEIVVVNDGGARVQFDGVKLIEHETSRGRSVAANEGVRAASNAFIAFLDDDDLFYPEHLPVLARATATPRAGWYSDAVSAFLRPAASGAYEAHSRLRIYSRDFDRELLLLDNYIPLPTLLVPRDTFLDLGGFDTSFDLFEDWDFLIRLAQRGDLLHVPRVTCEVRHFEGGESIVLAAPEGSPRFREAKLQVWKKHAALINNDVIANVFEREKSRAGSVFSRFVELEGSLDHARRDVMRLSREKDELVEKMSAEHETAIAATIRAYEVDAERVSVTSQLSRTSEALDVVRAEADSLRRANAETHAELERMRVENTRLHGLLDMIYRSRTWKMHTLVEKLRGRG